MEKDSSIEGPMLIDVFKFIHEKEKSLFSTFSPEQQEKFSHLCSNIGRATMKENGILTKADAKKIPDTTILGKESKKNFLKLQIWVLDFD